MGKTKQPEPKSLQDGLLEFYSSEADVLLARYKNINHLLGKTRHHTHPGALCEALIRDILRRNVPESKRPTTATRLATVKKVGRTSASRVAVRPAGAGSDRSMRQSPLRHRGGSTAGVNPAARCAESCAAIWSNRSIGGDEATRGGTRRHFLSMCPVCTPSSGLRRIGGRPSQCPVTAGSWSAIGRPGRFPLSLGAVRRVASLHDRPLRAVFMAQGAAYRRPRVQ